MPKVTDKDDRWTKRGRMDKARPRQEVAAASPTPVEPPPAAMPADDRTRLNDKQMAPPVPPDMRQHDPQGAVDGSQSWAPSRTLQGFELTNTGVSPEIRDQLA